jgi:hypothetical protein
MTRGMRSRHRMPGNEALHVRAWQGVCSHGTALWSSRTLDSGSHSILWLFHSSHDDSGQVVDRGGERS